MFKKRVKAGAPEWVMTYGDMMTLLLCFFIMLAAFADYDKGGGSSAAVIQAIQSIQGALGIKIKEDSALAHMVQFNAMVDQVKSAVQQLDPQYRGDSSEKGIQGKTFRLRRIRDGMEITIGGPILFEPFAARITPEGKESLERIGEILKGHRNKIEIVGHAAEQPRPADWTYIDAMQLAHERARHVADELVLRGVDPRTIRLVAVGANEPVAQDGLRRDGENRRVEIIVRESMIDDYKAEQPARNAEPLATRAVE
jgi:chemotaxis protein MotB